MDNGSSEEKARELSRANFAIRSLLDQLADHPDLNEFLGILLRSAANALGAPDAIVIVYQPDTDMLQALDCITSDPDGERIRNGYKEPFPAASATIWKHLLKTRAIEITDTEADERMIRPEVRAWHLARGNRTTVWVP
jgi:hypothetical protein